MKKLNKEELIEYFIEQLGDNNILGKYLSIEEIQNILSERIKEVRYELMDVAIVACYDNKNEIININEKLIQESEYIMRTILIHELLHVLSSSKMEKNGILIKKSGLMISSQTDDIETEENIFGNGIDEGFTELLAEEIAREKINDLLSKAASDERKQELIEELNSIQSAYKEEMDVTRILKILYGEEYLLGKYLSSIEDDKIIEDPYGLIVKEESDEKIILKEVIESLDIITGAKVFRDLKAVIKMINGKNVLPDRIQDLIKLKVEKIQDDEELKTILEQIIKVVSDSSISKMNYKTNLDCIMHFNSFKIANALQEILINENSGMQLGQMVDEYIRLTEPTESFDRDRGTAYEKWEHSIENYCIKKGMIAESKVKKSGMLAYILQFYKKDLKNMSDEDLKEILSHFGYTKVGTHYELAYMGDDEKIWGATHGFLFDEDGYMSITCGMFPHGDEWKCNSLAGIDSSKVDTEKMENIRIQLQNISANSEKSFTRAMVLGDDVILYYGGINDRIVYSLNEEGKLTLAETGVLRRITDDKSELDIKLQQETVDVSITEMMQEADSMQMILKDNKKENKESSKEDRYDE